MGLLGLDFLESKENKKLKDDAYNHLFFPYGDKQRAMIEQLLCDLFPSQPKDEAMFNYIVTKQKLMGDDCDNLKELVNDLNNRYMSKDVDTFLYITLAKIDLGITQDLNYPTIDDIKKQTVRF